MDWCNHEVNGTTLDPKVQYPEMVSDYIKSAHKKKNIYTL